MKKHFFVLVGLLFPLTAGAAELPPYDSGAYCKQVSAAGGGSYAIESACMDMEKEAREALAAMDIEPKILKYCDEVAKAGGGTYAILQACIEMEMESKKNLGK